MPATKEATLSDWVGRQGPRSEVRYGLTSDGILLVVQGEDDLCGMLEMLNQGVGGEAMVPDEEHQVQEGP